MSKTISTVGAPRGFKWEIHKYETFLVPVADGKVSTGSFRKTESGRGYRAVAAGPHGHEVKVLPSVVAAKRWLAAMARAPKKRRTTRKTKKARKR